MMDLGIGDGSPGQPTGWENCVHRQHVLNESKVSVVVSHVVEDNQGKEAGNSGNQHDLGKAIDHQLLEVNDFQVNDKTALFVAGRNAMNSYHVKLLAALCMVIDHVGVVLFPDAWLLRCIGRFSFPLFCWLLVQGEAHTTNLRKYALRLLGLGILSQPIYMLTFRVQRPNILFLLLLGLLCLRFARTFPRWQGFVWLGAAMLATATDTEYGSYGIALIALVGWFEPTWIWWISWLLLHLALWLILPSLGSLQIPAILAPLLFCLTNQQRGAKARWFYLFYPLHLLALLLIRDGG